MRFALKTAPQMTTWRDLEASWRAADGIPLYESAWLFDHLYPIFSDPDGPCFEGWTTLTALGVATKRIRLGLMVTGAPYRNPSLVAKMAATLDVITDGRVELGLGAGWNAEEAEAFGFDMRRPSERLDAFAEYLEITTRLLRDDDRVTVEGRYHQVRSAVCVPAGEQQRIPITIGGAGPRRTLPLVARFADHWNFPYNKAAVWQERRERLLELCDELGRDPATITTSVQLQAKGNDPDALRARIEDWISRGLDLAIIYLRPPHLAADVEAIATRLADLHEGDLA